MASLMDLYGGPMLEGGPDYDPWSMQAARYRRRYPTRMPDPRALAASRGAVGFADLPGLPEARQQAFNVYAGEDYNPSSLVQMAMGAVGAPGLVGGVPAGALGSGVGRGIRAYHGSPYDFERFDLGKIGTGEGAQAYGHGLYFAENPEVALDYRKRLSRSTTNFPVPIPDDVKGALKHLDYGGFDYPGQFLNAIRDDVRKGIDWRTNWDIRPGDEAAARIINKYVTIDKPPSGRMYEVNIRAEPQQFLDWDKRLAQQSPEVMAALRNVPWAEDYLKSQNLMGGQIAPRTSEGGAQLREAGIPGIRYLDQGSRMPAMRAQAEISRWEQALARADTPYEIQRTTEGLARAKEQAQGTSNYVLFRDDIIDIVRKYGWAGLAAFGISEEQAKEAGVDKPKTRIGNKSYEM